jgi:hypothetical protein
MGTNNYHVGTLLKGDIPESRSSLLIGIEIGKSGLTFQQVYLRYLNFMYRTRNLRTKQQALNAWRDMSNQERVEIIREILAK